MPAALAPAAPEAAELEAEPAEPDEPEPAAEAEKPHPCFPLSRATAAALHSPLGFAQQPLAQSASLRHAPVMNCLPAPLPTFAAPAALEDSVCARSPPEPLPLSLALDAAGLAALADAEPAEPAEEPDEPVEPEDDEDDEEEEEAEKPHPVFPCCVWAPTPEQMPTGPAQQADWQSALDRQAPVMNWAPWPLPTFLAPLGSGVRGEGMAREREARARSMAAVVLERWTILVVC